jgi:flavin-dependent dehydrogenase
VARGGEQVSITREETQAYVIDRVAFVSLLAERARRAGVSYLTGHTVTGVTRHGGYVEVRAQQSGVEQVLQARCVVVASGTGTKVAEMAGLSPARELMFASQAVISAPGLEEVHVLLPGILPRGYFGWIVPQGGGAALLGLLGRQRDERALHMAAQYVASVGLDQPGPFNWRHWPVPVAPAAATSADRALLVGDAAGQVKPTSGGGIYYALLSADIAADTLGRALASDDLSAASLHEYDVAWKAVLQKELRVGSFARSIFERLDGPALLRLLRAAEASGLLNGRGSFDWHSEIISRVFSNRLFDASTASLRAVSRFFSRVR